VSDGNTKTVSLNETDISEGCNWLASVIAARRNVKYGRGEPSCCDVASTKRLRWYRKGGIDAIWYSQYYSTLVVEIK